METSANRISRPFLTASRVTRTFSVLMGLESSSFNVPLERSEASTSKESAIIRSGNTTTVKKARSNLPSDSVVGLSNS